ncbi:astacin [Dictyocaulus viviparus]|uniref:Zinc metalloproteinase n=1 Tax=Dictyocaulus viviparus TaxID=29172 RepID=A0A0D8XHJ8_DICVI|nr:astacin [Dictyocaulus viviparus]
MWMSVIVSTWYVTAAVDENAIKEISKVLITSNVTDKNETTGPDINFIKRVVAQMELYKKKRIPNFARQSSQDENFDMEQYRNKVGPRSNLTAPPEAHKSLSAVAFEGDMIFHPDQFAKILDDKQDDVVSSERRQKRQSEMDPRTMWNQNQSIAYYIDPSLYGSSDIVNKAFKFWGDNTCLRFVTNTTAFNRLRVYKGSGCWSYVGKQFTWASQDISIGQGCENLGTICHEIAHALGLFHTQSRYDRDNYIRVNYNNIDPRLQYNFEKLTSAPEMNFNIQYDYGSVMQYNPYAFALNYNIPTSIAKDLNYQNIMGQRQQPAFSDVKQINLLYKCSARCTSTSPTCQNNGIVNPNTCKTCICPYTFDGDVCEKLKQGSAEVCNGQVITANSTSYKQFNATVGYKMDYAYSDITYDCYWHIKAPPGRRLQFQIKSLNTYCIEACNWSGFEINTGNLDVAGMLLCCPSISTSIFTSIKNIITIRGMTRYNTANMVISYRIV